LCPACFKFVEKKESRKGIVDNMRSTFGGILKK
jgi:hypothetical protein